MSLDYITVWYNPNKKTYYYKRISGWMSRHPVGYINQYGHEVILTIDLYKEYHRVPLKKRLITKAISFLERYNK